MVVKCTNRSNSHDVGNLDSLIPAPRIQLAIFARLGLKVVTGTIWTVHTRQ